MGSPVWGNGFYTGLEQGLEEGLRKGRVQSAIVTTVSAVTIAGGLSLLNSRKKRKNDKRHNEASERPNKVKHYKSEKESLQVDHEEISEKTTPTQGEVDVDDPTAT